MSVATARNGIGSRSKLADAVDAARELVQEELEIAAGQRALEAADLAVAEADLERQREARVALLVAERRARARGGESENSVGQSTDVTIRSISAGDMPLA